LTCRAGSHSQFKLLLQHALKGDQIKYVVINYENFFAAKVCALILMSDSLMTHLSFQGGNDKLIFAPLKVWSPHELEFLLLSWASEV
jgi:hypothetical protein